MTFKQYLLEVKMSKELEAVVSQAGLDPNKVDKDVDDVRKIKDQMVMYKDLKSNKDVQTKVGRILKKIYPDAPDNTISKVVTAYVAKLAIDTPDENSNTEIVLDDKVSRWYNYGCTINAGGLSARTNCMLGKKNFVKMYDDVCYILVMKNKDDNMLSARALVWHTDDHSWLMDRVYAVDDKIIEIFHEYARRKGWAYRIGGVAGEKPKILRAGGPYDKEFRVTIPWQKILKQKFLPYLDTLFYAYTGAPGDEAPGVVFSNNPNIADEGLVYAGDAHKNDDGNLELLTTLQRHFYKW